MIRQVISAVLGLGLMLNMLISSLSVLIYEVNQSIQAGSNESLKEVSITICTTSCTITKKIKLEQTQSPNPRHSTKVVSNNLKVFWKEDKLIQFSVYEGSSLKAPGFVNPLYADAHLSNIFVPPQNRV